MKPNKTEIIFLIDRSGSMQTIKSDIEGGVRSILEKQKENKDECLVSVYLFDDRYEAQYEGVNINEAKDIEIKPRGNTALYDALGKTIASVGERLNALPESEKPSKVIFITVTDGFENCSKEYTAEQNKNTIKHQTDVYKWEFLYVGTNQDAVLEGKSLGYCGTRSITYSHNSAGITGVMAAVSSGVSCMRAGQDYSGFTAAQRSESLVS